jgi:hypothetical protein
VDGSSIAVRGGRTRRFVMLALGLTLLATAVAVATRHHDLSSALAAARAASPWLLAVALALPVLNWLAVALSLWVLTVPHGRVGCGEMAALVGNAWLLNYVPLRPGMVGRFAYHKVVNRIPLGTTTAVLLAGVASSAAMNALMFMIAIVVWDRASPVVVSGVVASPAAVLGVWALMMARRGGRWRFIANLALRYVDALAWACRWLVVFALVGRPIDLPMAAAAAAIAQIAMSIPLTGNGLGLREWAVGLASAWLPPAFVGAAMDIESGTGAALVDRAAEVLAAIVVGLLSALALARRHAPARRASGAEHPS